MSSWNRSFNALKNRINPLSSPLPIPVSLLSSWMKEKNKQANQEIFLNGNNDFFTPNMYSANNTI